MIFFSSYGPSSARRFESLHRDRPPTESQNTLIRAWKPADHLVSGELRAVSNGLPSSEPAAIFLHVGTGSGSAAAKSAVARTGTVLTFLKSRGYQARKAQSASYRGLGDGREQVRAGFVDRTDGPRRWARAALRLGVERTSGSFTAPSPAPFRRRRSRCGARRCRR